MRIVDMGELCGPSPDLQRHRAAGIGLLGHRPRRHRRRRGAGDPVPGAGGQPDPDIVLRHHSDAFRLERSIAADMIAVEVGVDQIFYGLVRQRRDRGLELVVHEREPASTMMMPSPPTATVTLRPAPSSRYALLP